MELDDSVREQVVGVNPPLRQVFLDSQLCRCTSSRACACVSFQAARPWYERLFGEPSFFPHDTEAVWTLADDRSIYVVEHPEGAGKSVVTLFVDDLDARVTRSPPAGSNPTSASRTPTACARRTTTTPTATRSRSAARRSTPAHSRARPLAPNGFGGRTRTIGGESPYASVSRLVVWATLAPCFAATSLAIHSTFRCGIGAAEHQDRARLLAGTDRDVGGSRRGVQVVPPSHPPLFALHDGDALAAEHEEPLLRRLRVVGGRWLRRACSTWMCSTPDAFRAHLRNRTRPRSPQPSSHAISPSLRMNQPSSAGHLTLRRLFDVSFTHRASLRLHRCDPRWRRLRGFSAAASGDGAAGVTRCGPGGRDIRRRIRYRDGINAIAMRRR